MTLGSPLGGRGVCQVLKHLWFLPEADGRSLGERSRERCCLVPGFLLTVKAEGIGDLTAEEPHGLSRFVEIPGGTLLEKTACQQDRLDVPRCFPVCQTLSRREIKDPGKGCQEPGCSRARPCCTGWALQGAEHRPGWGCAGRELQELQGSKRLPPGPGRPTGSSLQAGLGFRSRSCHQSIAWTGATGS